MPALAQLLSVPIEEMGLNVFSLEAYPKLANFLQWDQRRDMALRLVQRIISGGGEGLDNLDTVKALFAFIGPLVADQEDGPSEDEEDHVRVAARLHSHCSAASPHTPLPRVPLRHRHRRSLCGRSTWWPASCP